MSMLRTRWAAIGAAVAVSLGAGGIGLVSATDPAGALTLIPITPCRVIDTRPAFNVGPKASPLGPGETHSVTAHGDNGDCAGIPSDAVALSMNVTAVDATTDTFLTIWAADAARPVASSLNPSPGAPPAPNAVTTELDGNGEFSIYNLAGNVHVLADINGYYVDHHHDDRYYTEDEIDARSAGEIIAMGVINTAPAIFEERVRDGVTIEVSSPAAGAVTMRILGADTDDVPIAIVTPHYPAAAARTCNTRNLTSVSSSEYTIRIDCYDATGTPIATAFQFVVMD